MRCKKCWGPVGTTLNCFRWIHRSKNQFEFSETAKAIEKIEKGINCPKYNPESFIPGLKKEIDFIKNEGEWAFGFGWKYAMLHCKELLAKAQNDDK